MLPDFEAPIDADGNNDYEVQVTVTDGAGATDVQTLTVNVTGCQRQPAGYHQRWGWINRNCECGGKYHSGNQCRIHRFRR